MASAEDVKKEIEEARELLGTKVDNLVARTKYELDWKGHLKRHLPKVLAGAAAVGVVVVGGLVVKSRLGARNAEERARIALTNPVDLTELAVQLRAMREELEERFPREDTFLARTASRYLTAAGVATGTLATQYILRRFVPDIADDVDPDNAKGLAKNVTAVG